jgi:glycosyltransferase involved in cell wall biosynthesis
VVPAVGHPHLTRADPEPGPGPGAILLNGRVTTRPRVTGVERWAAELIPRLSALAPDRYAAVVPPPRARTRGLGQAWEQLVLPAQAVRRRASLIFSPANLAPVLWPRNVLVLHDAAVLREPEAYSRAYRAWHRHLGMRSARAALAVITVSEFSRRELIELAGLDHDRLVVIRGGVDERFGPSADHERVARKLGLGGQYVLTVASNDRRKNLQVLELAARRLRTLGVELVWAGDRRPHMTHTPSIAGVRALGYVEEADLPGLYAGARAFVLPSRYEGLGLTCLEAMACGTPVVAADRAALPETCGTAALLVDPDDAEAVARAVLSAAGDEPLRRRLREAGLRRAARCTWEYAASEVDALLGGLVDG